MPRTLDDGGLKKISSSVSSSSSRSMLLIVGSFGSYHHEVKFDKYFLPSLRTAEYVHIPQCYEQRPKQCRLWIPDLKTTFVAHLFLKFFPSRHHVCVRRYDTVDLNNALTNNALKTLASLETIWSKLQSQVKSSTQWSSISRNLRKPHLQSDTALHLS